MENSISVLTSFSSLLKPFGGNENFVIRRVNGSKTFLSSSKMFVKIIDCDTEDGDLSFVNPGPPTEDTPVQMFKVDEPMKLRTIFEAASCFRVVQAPSSDVKFRIIPGDVEPDVNKSVLTQHQITEFLTNYRRWLNESFSTLFLFKADCLRVAAIETRRTGGLVMFVRKLDDSLSTEKGYVVVPSIIEIDMELGYLEDAPPLIFETEHGRLCKTGTSEEEQDIKRSLGRYQREDPAHNYILMPFDAKIETFSARTNNVIRWRKENGFSIWRTS